MRFQVEKMVSSFVQSFAMESPLISVPITLCLLSVLLTFLECMNQRMKGISFPSSNLSLFLASFVVGRTPFSLFVLQLGFLNGAIILVSLQNALIQSSTISSLLLLRFSSYPITFPSYFFSTLKNFPVKFEIQSLVLRHSKFISLRVSFGYHLVFKNQIFVWFFENIGKGR